MNHIPLPEGFFWDETFQLGAESSALTKLIWPNFLVEKSDIPEPRLTFRLTRQELARRFPAWGIRRTSDKQLAAYAHAALILTDSNSNQLPDSGWQFAIESSMSSEITNTLCLLAANVRPEFRSLGLSRALIERAKIAGKNLGCSTLTGPVRPVNKSDYPLEEMDSYLKKKSPSGDAFDPWVKLHLRCGGTILNVCQNSVVVKASLPKWRAWTGLSLDKAGDQVIPLALAPLKVDLDGNVGVYCEPNVWVRYNL